MATTCVSKHPMVLCELLSGLFRYVTLDIGVFGRAGQSGSTLGIASSHFN